MTGYISPFECLIRQKQRESDEISRLVAEFEAKGGKIQKLNPGESSQPVISPRHALPQIQYQTKRGLE